MGGGLRNIGSVEEFDGLLASSSRPVLVDLTAAWCAPCQALTPVLEDFAAEHAEGVEVVAVDVDALPGLYHRLTSGKSGIPQLLLFDRQVLQLSVLGAPGREWLDDTIGGYASLQIGSPDGQRLPELSPARWVELPAPAAGTVRLNGVDPGEAADPGGPRVVEVPAGGQTRLQVSSDAIRSGYLRKLDPSSIDHLVVVGDPVTAAHLQEIAVLTGVKSVLLFAAEVEPEDVAVLAALPGLRTLDVRSVDRTPIPIPSELLPMVRGAAWMAPSLRVARAERGLPERRQPSEAGSPFTTGCLAQRREDGLVELTVMLIMREGWYAYPPGSTEGVPVSITTNSAHEVVEALRVAADIARLSGRADLSAVLRGDEDDVRFEVTVQVCDGTVCLPPERIRLVVPTLSPDGPLARRKRAAQESGRSTEAVGA
jgi:thioredoxin 1